MRCKHCGSTNVQKTTLHQADYSYGKGLIGTLVFGPGGAVAGVGGKDKSTTEYHCMACGEIGDRQSMLMDWDIEDDINTALKYDDTEKLKELKWKYRNIEWNETQTNLSTQQETTASNKRKYKPTYNQQIPHDSNKFDLYGSTLMRYRGYSDETVDVPNGVFTIYSSAFSYNSSIKKIIIPESVRFINYCAFVGCKNLTSINIPENVTSIDFELFKDCSNLTSITIPNKVTSIGESAFSGCSSLTNITIPNKVTSIGESAFSGCSSLTNITIPNNVTSIDESAFSGCSNLTSITIPNKVTSIGESAFSGCSNLTNITIPNKVTYIGEGAFSDCNNIISITIPSSVIYIGPKAFEKCKSLQSIKFEDPIGWSIKDMDISDLDNAENAFTYIINNCINSPIIKNKNENHKQLQTINKRVEAYEVKKEARAKKMEEIRKKKQKKHREIFIMSLFAILSIIIFVVGIWFDLALLGTALSILIAISGGGIIYRDKKDKTDKK